MELNELIEKLEKAQGQATEGKWRADGSIIDIWNDDDMISGSPVSTIHDKDAQAIATRHNTALDILPRLRELSLLRPLFVKTDKEARTLRIRVTKAEEESARLKRALIGTGISPRLAAAIAEGSP